jgi:hypothetical protein
LVGAGLACSARPGLGLWSCGAFSTRLPLGSQLAITRFISSQTKSDVPDFVAPPEGVEVCKEFLSQSQLEYLGGLAESRDAR